MRAIAKAEAMVCELSNIKNQTYYFTAFGVRDFRVELGNRQIFRGNWENFKRWIELEKNF